MLTAVRGDTRRSLDVGAGLSAGDASRVERVFARFERLGFRDHVVVGGLALEAALWPRDRRCRPLNDIDVVTSCFEALPASLGERFLVRHVHRDRPRGKLMVQLVCPEDAVRIDVFGACGAILSRAWPGTIDARRVRVAALEDMASRIVSELMNMVRSETVHAKVVQDDRRLATAVDPAAVEVAWSEQRRAGDPESFTTACRMIEVILGDAGHRFTKSTSVAAGADCPHCRRVDPFTLANPDRMEALLGYR